MSKNDDRNSAAPPCSLACPNCGGARISGLMAAFWVTLTDDETMDGKWSDYESCTEIGDERLCADCGHEW